MWRSVEIREDNYIRQRQDQPPPTDARHAAHTS